MAKDKVERPELNTSAVMSFPQPPVRNAEEFLKAYSGYAYTAISAIAQEVASIDLHLFKSKFTREGPENTEIYEHEVLSLFGYVNPLMTFYDLIEATQIYLELTGEAFWVVLKQGTTPKELWLLRPDWVKIVPDVKDVISHYVYCPGGNVAQKVDIPKENIIHFKYFNPLNPYRGRGSIQAAAMPLDIHTFAQEYNRNFFFNSALPSMVFTSEKNLSETVIKRFINQWQASYGGRGKSNKIAFLGNGLKVDKIGTAAKELDFAEQQKMMRDDVLAVFKVPKTVLGLTEDVNRANADATTLAFMERVITPRMIKFVGTLNEFLLPMYEEASLFLDFVDPAPQDTEMKLKRYESGRKFGWMSANEVRGEENMEPIEGGDDYTPVGGAKPSTTTETPTEDGTAPTDGTDGEDGNKGLRGVLRRIFTKQEAKKVLSTAPKVMKKQFKHMMKPPVKRIEQLEREKLTEKLTPAITKIIGDLLLKKEGNNVGMKEEKPEGEDKKPVFTEETKVAYWKQFIEQITEREAELRNKAVELFKEQEITILGNIDENVKFWRKEVRKGKAGSVVPTIAELSVIWHRVWQEAVKEIYIEQGNYTLDFLGVGGTIDVTTDFAVEYLQKFGGILITDINRTTREKLMDTLSEGFDNGESIDQLKARVKKTFKEATTSRAEAIARTEALRASNAATVEAYRQSGVVEAKEWLTERDEKACVFCLEQDGKVLGLNKDFFKAGQTIEVNGEKLTIGVLAVGEPPLHTNCRCTTIPVLVGEE